MRHCNICMKGNISTVQYVYMYVYIIAVWQLILMVTNLCLSRCLLSSMLILSSCSLMKVSNASCFPNDSCGPKRRKLVNTCSILNQDCHTNHPNENACLSFRWNKSTIGKSFRSCCAEQEHENRAVLNSTCSHIHRYATTIWEPDVS